MHVLESLSQRAGRLRRFQAGEKVQQQRSKQAAAHYLSTLPAAPASGKHTTWPHQTQEAVSVEYKVCLGCPHIPDDGVHATDLQWGRFRCFVRGTATCSQEVARTAQNTAPSVLASHGSSSLQADTHQIQEPSKSRHLPTSSQLLRHHANPPPQLSEHPISLSTHPPGSCWG